MAFELNYTSETGANFPQSYWKITKIEIDIVNKQLIYTFSGYKDKEAAGNDKRPIASRIYRIDRAQNENYKFSLIIKGIDDGSLNLLTVGYNLARDSQDYETGELTTKEISGTRQIIKSLYDASIGQNVNAFVEESCVKIVPDFPVSKSFFDKAINI